MLVTMKDIQVIQERYGDYQKDAQKHRLLRGEQKRTRGGWRKFFTALEAQRRQMRSAGQWNSAAGIPESSH